MSIQDISQVVEIEQQVQYHPWTRQQFTDSLHHYQCTVLADLNQIIGFCILQPVLDEANLLLMAIHPDYQGRNLGYQILTQSIEQLKQQRLLNQIFLEVREHNQAAIKLYEKIGFHQIDMRKNYYPAPHGKKEHAVIMVYMCHDDCFHFNDI